MVAHSRTGQPAVWAHTPGNPFLRSRDPNATIPGLGGDAELPWWQLGRMLRGEMAKKKVTSPEETSLLLSGSSLPKKLRAVR